MRTSLLGNNLTESGAVGERGSGLHPTQTHQKNSPILHLYFLWLGRQRKKAAILTCACPVQLFQSRKSIFSQLSVTPSLAWPGWQESALAHNFGHRKRREAHCWKAICMACRWVWGLGESLATTISHWRSALPLPLYTGHRHSSSQRRLILESNKSNNDATDFCQRGFSAWLLSGGFSWGQSWCLTSAPGRIFCCPAALLQFSGTGWSSDSAFLLQLPEPH